MLTSYKTPEQIGQWSQSNYYNDPLSFARDVLRIKELHEKPQKEALRALATGRNVCMRTGHGVGKSFTLAVGSMWYFFTRPFCRVVYLGPSWGQLKNYLWAEIDKMWMRLPEEWSALATKSEQQNYYMNDFRRQWAAFTMSPENSDLIEGLHAGHILVIFEEAKAIKKEHFAAIQGAATSKYMQKFMGSTPGDPEGEFYEANTRLAHLWEIVHASEYDSPLVDPRTIEEKIKMWGKDSPLFIAKVMGNFAPGGTDRIFSITNLESCMDTFDAPSGPTWLGVDVARFGEDETAFCVVRGGQLIKYEKYGGKSLMHTVGRIMDYFKEYNLDGIVPDDRGLGGGVTDRLRELLPDRCAILPINGSEPIIDKQHYGNWQTELLFTIHDKIKAGEIKLGGYEEIRAQLSTIPYDYTSDQRFIIKRGFHLPDGAAAFSYALYGSMTETHSSFSSFKELNQMGRSGY